MKVTFIYSNSYITNSNFKHNNINNKAISHNLAINTYNCSELSIPRNIYYKPLNIHFSSSKNKNIAKDFFNKLANNDFPIEELPSIKKQNNEVIDEFIDEYCRKTGFPNLTVVNTKMKNHAVDVINAASKNSNLNVVWSGFHKQCSASSNLALPGSDLDASAVIVDGDQSQIDEFKNNLWNLYNPLIVSIRKDFEFPDVFSIQQLYEWTNLLDKVMIENGYSKKSDKYLSNFEETKDYERALEFNIDAAEAISKCTYAELVKNAPSVKVLLDRGETPKNITQSMSSCLESMRSGIPLSIEKENILTEESKAMLSRIKNSYLYRYGNICIQEAKYKPKEKLLKRKEVITEAAFNMLSREDKLNFILKMIYESYPYYLKIKLQNNDINNSFIYYSEALFDNGEGINQSRVRAYEKTVDS